MGGVGSGVGLDFHFLALATDEIGLLLSVGKQRMHLVDLLKCFNIGRVASVIVDQIVGCAKLDHDN